MFDMTEHANQMLRTVGAMQAGKQKTATNVQGDVHAGKIGESHVVAASPSLPDPAQVHDAAEEAMHAEEEGEVAKFCEDDGPGDALRRQAADIDSLKYKTKGPSMLQDEMTEYLAEVVAATVNIPGVKNQVCEFHTRTYGDPEWWIGCNVKGIQCGAFGKLFSDTLSKVVAEAREASTRIDLATRIEELQAQVTELESKLAASQALNAEREKQLKVVGGSFGYD
jgi:hypothetical protein